MELGTRLQTHVLDDAGNLAIDTDGVRYSGRLVDSLSQVDYGQHIRIQLNLDSSGATSSFDATVTLVGVVAPLDDDTPMDEALLLERGALFVVEVLRLTRGLLWSLADQAPLPAAPVAAPEQLSKSGVVVRVSGPTGKLEIYGANQMLDGWLVRIPLEFFIGQQLHLRVVVESAQGSENMDVLGKVVQILEGERQPGHAPFRDGVRFGFGIVQHSSGEIPLPVVGEEWIDDFLVDSASVPPEVLAPAPPMMGLSDDSEKTEVTPFDAVEEPISEEMLRDPSGVVGSIEQMPLVDLVQSLELNRRTARIDMSALAQGCSGSVFIKKGQVVAASCGDERGEAAFFTMALARSGAFRVHYNQQAKRENIGSTTTVLILEVMRRLDMRGAPAPVALPPFPAEQTEITSDEEVVTEETTEPETAGDPPGEVTPVEVTPPVRKPPAPKGRAGPPVEEPTPTTPAAPVLEATVLEATVVTPPATSDVQDSDQTPVGGGTFAHFFAEVKGE